MFKKSERGRRGKKQTLLPRLVVPDVRISQFTAQEPQGPDVGLRVRATRSCGFCRQS